MMDNFPVVESFGAHEKRHNLETALKELRDIRIKVDKEELELITSAIHALEKVVTNYKILKSIK